MRISRLLAIGASSLALAGVAFAQEQTINDYVRSMVASYADASETLVDRIMLEELELFDEAEFIFDIDPDKTYYVYGACDDDCYDIDLSAHDADENEVTYDDAEDAEPMLIIGPGEAGSELHVVVSLGDCDTDTCVVGLGVYEAIDWSVSPASSRPPSRRRTLSPPADHEGRERQGGVNPRPRAGTASKAAFRRVRTHCPPAPVALTVRVKFRADRSSAAS